LPIVQGFYSERKQAQDAYGRRRYLDTGEIVPGFDEVKSDRETHEDDFGRLRYVDTGEIVTGFDGVKPDKPNDGFGISFDEDGNISYVGTGASGLGRSGQSTSAGVLGDSYKAAGKTDQAYSLLKRAQDHINSPEFSSGALNRIKTGAAAIASDVPGLGGLVDDKKLSGSEEFRAINNQLAAAMLEMFGGSDTEKELAISVASNVGPDIHEDTNKRMIGPALQFVETQRQKPSFQAQWIERFGGIERIDPNTGRSMQQQWDAYLQQEHNALFAGVDSSDAEAMNEATDWKPPLSPEERQRLLEQRAKYGGGE